MGCFFLDLYDHVLAFEVITIGPGAEIVDITLQVMIVSRCVN